MKLQVTHKEIKEFGRLNIQIAQLKAGIRELAEYGHIYDSGARLCVPTRQSMEIRLDRLLKERDSLIG